MTTENSKTNVLIDFLGKNAWAIAMVTASVVAQWAVFGVRLDNLEGRVDRQGTAITEVRTSLAETQNQYSALSAKLEGIDQNVNYIRNRIDRATDK